jgi:hypothetical protein
MQQDDRIPVTLAMREIKKLIPMSRINVEPASY